MIDNTMHMIWISIAPKKTEQNIKKGEKKKGDFLFFIFLSGRLLSVLCGHSGFSISATTANDLDFEGFLYQILSITYFSYLNS